MNKKPRRKFSSEFKTKVAFDALRERESIKTLCKKYDLHPNQIFHWKKTLMKSIPHIFSGEKEVKDSSHEKLIDDLYRSIGELKIANCILNILFMGLINLLSNCVCLVF